MKNFATFIVLAIVAAFLPTSASAQRAFEEVANKAGVTSVYMGPAILHAAGENVLGIYGLYSDWATKVSSIEVIEFDGDDDDDDEKGKPDYKGVSQQISGIIRNMNTETLLESRDGKELSRISVILSKDSQKTATGVIILQQDGDLKEIKVVMIEGEIDLAKLVKYYSNQVVAPSVNL